jgi:hypothetical protein
MQEGRERAVAWDRELLLFKLKGRKDWNHEVGWYKRIVAVDTRYNKAELRKRWIWS